MATLNWIGKEKVINHHLDVPFRTLKHKYTYKDGKKLTDGTTSDNKIIHGDNLEALKSLLPEYEGKIKCIYIDPPYNTGKEDWVYNDNVNHPKIKKWLGQVVGKEGDDLSRHDKWLCMMYPRLKLLHKLLSEDGVIFISIDDNEVANLKVLLDEIFGESRFVSTLSIENNPKGRKNSSFISISNEYCLIYAKDKNKSYFKENVPKKAKDLTKDENGIYVHNSGKRVLVGENSFNDPVEDFNSNKHYSVYYNPKDKDLILLKEKQVDEENKELINNGYERYYSYKNNSFVLNTYTDSKIKELYEKGALEFKNNKIYEKNFSTTIRLKSLVTNKKYDAIIDNTEKTYIQDVKTTSAGTELKNIFGTPKTIFDNPKNTGLIELLITLIDDTDFYVLDSFAGSGTTAHSVLNANEKDGGDRKFILVEMEDYAEDITAGRVKRVIDGYGKGKKKIDGTGGDFEYLELGDPLFNEDEYINENQSVEDIRKYVYYSETRTNTGYSDNPRNEFYLGKRSNTAYYFYYKKDAITTLDLEFASQVTIKADQYIIYADKCTLSEEYMRKHNIIFKKIPRDITKS